MELLQNYSLEQIVIFIVILALTIKGAVDFYDWAKSKTDKRYAERKAKDDKDEKYAKALEEHQKSFDKLFKLQDDISTQIESLTKNIDLLMKSDKDDIKSYITEKHHFFCYEQHWIDDYSLDCLERRYNHYVDEGGNSYIKSLMDEIRLLPKQPMENRKSK